MRTRFPVSYINEAKPHNSRLTAIEFVEKPNQRNGKVLVICSCGSHKIIRVENMLVGHTLSCGCLKKETDRGRRESIESVNKRLPLGSYLVAIEHAIYDTSKSDTRIIVMCKCGKTFDVIKSSVISGSTLSCGCLNIERVKEANTKYYCHNKIIECYRGMIKRCYSPSIVGYKSYGGRGVRVCDEWKNNPQSFINWMIQNNWKEGLQIDKDIKGDGLLYSPETCCLVTASENNLNRRTTVRVMYKGEMVVLSKICRIENVCYHGMYNSIARKGLSIEEAIKKEKESNRVFVEFWKHKKKKIK